MKILGAGLASSFGEAHFAGRGQCASPRFTLRDAAATGYRSDAFQPLYFVSDSLERAAAELEALDLAGLACSRPSLAHAQMAGGFRLGRYRL